MENIPVGIKPAVWWTCENCNTEHFEKCYNAEFKDKEEEVVMLLSSGIDPEEVETLTMYPDIVECEKCKSKYYTYFDEHPITISLDDLDDDEI